MIPSAAPSTSNYARDTIVALVTSLLLTCDCSLCGDTPKSRALSTDQKLVATVYERNCGATTDFSSMVNVQGSSQKFDGDEYQVFVAKGRYDNTVQWAGPKELTVLCEECARNNIYKEVTVLGDIDISLFDGHTGSGT